MTTLRCKGNSHGQPCDPQKHVFVLDTVILMYNNAWNLALSARKRDVQHN